MEKLTRFKTYTTSFTHRPRLRSKDEEDEMMDVINAIHVETRKIMETYKAYQYLDKLSFDFSQDERRL